jgi:hypothetical protein
VRHEHGEFGRFTGDGTTRSKRSVHGAGGLDYTRQGKGGRTAITLGLLVTRSSSRDEERGLPSSEPKTSTAGVDGEVSLLCTGLAAAGGKTCASERGSLRSSRPGELRNIGDEFVEFLTGGAEQNGAKLLLLRRRRDPEGKNGTLGAPCSYRGG